MQLGADEGQPLLQAIALHGAGLGRQAAVGLLIGNVLHDGRALAQQLAIVQTQRRDVALGIDGQIVLAMLGLLGLEIDLDQIKRQTSLAQGDMRGDRTGTRGVVKLHRRVLGSSRELQGVVIGLRWQASGARFCHTSRRGSPGWGSPNSRSTSSVCSPRLGAWRRMLPGVSENFTGMPGAHNRPSVGCSKCCQ